MALPFAPKSQLEFAPAFGFPAASGKYLCVIALRPGRSAGAQRKSSACRLSKYIARQIFAIYYLADAGIVLPSNTSALAGTIPAKALTRRKQAQYIVPHKPAHEGASGPTWRKNILKNIEFLI